MCSMRLPSPARRIRLSLSGWTCPDQRRTSVVRTKMTSTTAATPCWAPVANCSQTPPGARTLPGSTTSQREMSVSVTSACCRTSSSTSRSKIPAPDGHKANVFLHVAPGLRNVDFPMLYDLMNLAGVTGFERTDLRWLEVAERSTGPSALESAVHHVRDLEKCPNKAVDILALPVPSASTKEGYNATFFGRYIQGKHPQFQPEDQERLTWAAYRYQVLPAVRKMKQAVKDAGGEVIQPKTLQEFIEKVQTLSRGTDATTITVMFVTDSHHGKKSVVFVDESSELSELVRQLRQIPLAGNVTLSALSCGFACSRHTGDLFEQNPKVLLIAPAERMTLFSACLFHMRFTEERKKGMSILDAFEEARRGRIKDLRQESLQQAARRLEDREDVRDIERFYQCDERSFEALVSRYHAHLISFFERCGLRNDAEDCAESLAKGVHGQVLTKQIRSAQECVKILAVPYSRVCGKG